jgi:hypothetical protein
MVEEVKEGGISKEQDFFWAPFLRFAQKTGLSAAIFFACGKKGFPLQSLARPRGVLDVERDLKPRTVILRLFRLRGKNSGAWF